MKTPPMSRVLFASLVAAPLLVVAFTETRAQRCTGVRIPSYAEMLVGGTQEFTLTKAIGAWKYKSPTVEQSDQMCIIGGKCPTAHQNLGDVPNFTVRTFAYHAYTPDYTGEFTGFEHTFALDPAGINSKGTRAKMNFYQGRDRSGAGGGAKYGSFKASIKNGEMSFLYKIPKGNASGMMVETGHYAWVQDCRTQDWFREYSHEKTMGGTRIMFGAGDEVFYSEVDCNVKIKKNKGKGKLAK